MTKLGKALSVGLSVVSAGAGVAAVVTTVENVKEQVVIQDVYEVIYGEDIYRFTDKEGNVYELTLEEFEAVKSGDLSVLETEEEQTTPSQDK